MPFERHLRLVEEDAAEMVAVGEDLGLVRQVRAAAVDQIDARQPVLLGDLLRAQMLLDRQRIVSAALHRRVVADDHHLPARHAADAGDHARARHFAVVHVAGGELADFEERRAGIEQPLDAVAGQQLAARRRGARGASRCRPAPPRATSARSFSASARLCAARARNSSLSVAILLSIRGALMPDRVAAAKANANYCGRFEPLPLLWRRASVEEAEAMTYWEFKGRELVNCTCEYGCNCQFNALPDKGHCHAVAGIQIDEGHHGDTRARRPEDRARSSNGPGRSTKAMAKRWRSSTSAPTRRSARPCSKIMTGQDTDPFATMFAVLRLDHRDDARAGVRRHRLRGRRRRAGAGGSAIPGYVEMTGEPIRNKVDAARNRARRSASRRLRI